MNVQLPLAIGQAGPSQTPAPHGVAPGDAPAGDGGVFEGLFAEAQQGTAGELPAVSLIGSVLVDGDGAPEDALPEAQPALGDGLDAADSVLPEVEPLDAELLDAVDAQPVGLLAPVVDAAAAAPALGAAAVVEAAPALPQVPPAVLGQAADQQASLVDAGRAPLAAPETPQAAPAVPGAGRTLDATPWFAVRATPAAAERGQALARAVQPALQDATPLATRAHRADAPAGSQQTALGTAAQVQAMVDGDIEVRAPDLVARAVTHNVARGAMLQAQRAQVELPQRVLPAAPATPAAVQAPVEPVVDADVAPTPDAPAAEPGAPATAQPAAARSAVAQNAAAPLPADVPLVDDGAVVPGTVDGPTTTVARGAGVAHAASADAALAAGRPTEAQLGQVAVPDGDHMELKVSDGDHSFRLSIAREADGLNVELKAPREIVADLRALEPDVEAALAEDGYDLASFDAHADDSSSDGSDAESHGGGAAHADDAGGDAPTAAPTPVAPAGQGRIVNRLA